MQRASSSSNKSATGVRSQARARRALLLSWAVAGAAGRGGAGRASAATVTWTGTVQDPNSGETSLNEIKALLAQKGLRLGQAVDGEKPVGFGGPRPASAASSVALENVSPEVMGKSVAGL